MKCLTQKQTKVTYLDDIVKNHLFSLISAVAEEAVCVDVVRITVQFDMHVVRSSEIILDSKSYLC